MMHKKRGHGTDDDDDDVDDDGDDDGEDKDEGDDDYVGKTNPACTGVCGQRRIAPLVPGKLPKEITKHCKRHLHLLFWLSRLKRYDCEREIVIATSQVICWPENPVLIIVF